MGSTPYGPKLDCFWEGIESQELRYRKCNSCHAALPSGSWVCPECWSKDLSWEVASGDGVIWSFVEYYRPFSPNETVPYNVVLVDLAEGIRMVANVDCATDKIYAGMAVRAEFYDDHGGVKLKFIPDGI